MRELVGRLEALDPDAGAALRVVTYFDQLVERRAGLENVVRGAAVLSGHPAVLVDADRGVRIRVEPDGVRRDIARPLEPGWCQLAVDAVTVCLEHPAPAGAVEAVVLERAVMAARTVLDRTRSRTRRPQRRDNELLEVLLDATAPDRDRTRAAQILGLPLDGRVRVVAAVDGRLDVEAVPETAEERTAPPGNTAARAGVGPAVPPLDLPWTVEQARAAARFTAEGTATDPGPRVVHAEDLGGMLLLAQAVDGHPESIPDLLSIEKAATAAPWVLPTLDVVAGSASLRAAAAALHVHHSTLQDRLGQAERLLGWSLRDVPGVVRLNIALVLRRLYRSRAPR
jgi:hypothetical protein